MPENTVYVGRPTQWGNYWQVGNIFTDAAGCKKAMSAQECVKRFLQDMAKLKANFPEIYWSRIRPLKGKNLACWCGVDQPCHADVLLELANQPEP